MTGVNKHQKELLLKWNQTELPFDESTCLPELFESQCKLTPENIALEFNEQKLTYFQLNEKSNKIAHGLLKKGVLSDQLVGICAERSFELIVGILGILKAGCAYVPFDASYPAERIDYMVAESGIKTVLIQESARPAFASSNAKLIAIDTEWDDFQKESGLNAEIKIVADQLAYVLFTSGSTGKPKGVAMVHRALMNLIHWQKNKTNLNTAARTLQFAPISFDVSFQEIFTTFTSGGTLVLITDELRLNAIMLLNFLNEKNIERIFLPFIALQHLTEVAHNSNVWPANLSDVITAGEQLQVTRHISDFFKHLPECKLHNHYGPTETHVVTACTLTGSASTWVALPPIGKPISNTHIYLLDENLAPVNEGDEGEIYVSGMSLARGYINQPELTASRFISNPFFPGSLMYKTGDIGKYISGGDIEYLGRADNQVKVRGYRIEPGEIEITLGMIPGIAHVAIIVREDIPGDKRLVAYLVKENKSKITVADLRKYLHGKLPEYMMPSAFVFLDNIPKTPSGKIDRNSFPAPDQNRPDIGIYAEPSSAIEKKVASIWGSLLQINKVGIDDNFFDLGGNSLLALQFIAKIRQQENMDVPVVKLYQHPTIKSLLNSLNSSIESASAYDKAKERATKHASSNTQNLSVENGIAIIGMSGRFPGAASVDEMWQNLLDGKETVSFFSNEEMDPFLSKELFHDTAYVKARGVIKDVDKFDAAFFNINPRLAELMDPQQRVFLEVCWEALENAGYTSYGYDGLIGVYAGMGNNTYYQNNVIHHKDSIEKIGSFQVMVANEKDYIATRISHFMNLKGPGLSIHTACSTSLTAVAMACQAIWNNQCDIAIAGGVSITSPVNSGHVYQEGGMFSGDGHTRSFDASASGTVFSDGGGVVILKKFKEAVADGDTIYAVVRGIGINNDGSDKASFTAPSVEGQKQAIAMALAHANVTPDSITYVETHGTATPLGDPIEIEALTQAFKGGTLKNQFCAIGSVKSNFGHLTAAAGIAGLIKTTLALKNKIIPASINYDKPNPAIDFTNSPFYVNSKQVPWKEGSNPRRAGISSFGVGGTNVHIIVEEAPYEKKSGPHRSRHLLLFSAKGKERLDAITSNFKNFINDNQEINIADAAYTLQTGRVSFADRKYFVVESGVDSVEQINSPGPVRSGSGIIQALPKGIAFMFPGQGSQYVNMGSNLYRDEIVFREAIDQCADILNNYLKQDLRTILYPVKGTEGQAEKLLQQTCYTQPALFTIGYALYKLWNHWGINPAVLIGHSIGEFTAACIAGIMKLEDALMLVAKRGELMQAQPGGSMLSVRLSAVDVEKYLTTNVSVAAINGPSLCVLSGNDQTINSIHKKLEENEIVCKKLFTSHAFHSPMMDAVVDPFYKILSGVKLNSPSIPVVSTATSNFLSDKEATDPGYWSKHLRLPVLFADGIKTIWSTYPDMVLLELGPRNTASSLAKQQAVDLKKQIAVPSLSDTAENDAEWVTMLNAIGRLWTSGFTINWKNFYALESRKHIPLPAYPFEKKRHWVDPVGNTQLNTVYAYQPFVADNAFLFNNENILSSSANSVNSMNIISRQNRIIAELRNVMEDASGIELSEVGTEVSFMELGLDSLFLTQAALTLSKKYGIKITFRQLNESLYSLKTLASYIDSALPPETVQQPAIGNIISNEFQLNPSATSLNNETPGTLQWLITQQLQVMQQQLAMVGGTVSPVVQPASSNQNSNPPVKHATESEINENEKAELSKPFGAIARIEKVVNTELTGEQKKWLSDFTARYNKKTAKSKSYTADNRSHLADPRVVTGFKPALKELIYQVVVDKSKGSKLWDIDGNEYLDVLNGFGSNFLGYGSEIIMKAVMKQLESGIELGPQHPLAGEVAKLICDFTGYDRAGFCNTGSEAVLGALRIARTVTGRSIVVCFNGSYHGINDEVIVRGTKKLKSFPASAGIMPEAVENMLVLDYGTDEALEIIRSRAGDIAAVMVEPIQSRRADFRPTAFIQEVRKITEAAGALLIFDEVITGFRLLPGGAQSFYGVKADIGTYGKVIGGGMPIGVIAGRREYMDALDGGSWQFGDNSVPESGVTYFAGTFVRHPLALAAAKAVLIHLQERGMTIYEKLNGYTDKFVKSVNDYNTKSGAPFHLVSFGSLFKFKWDTEQPYGELIFLLLRERGIHIYDGFPCFFTDAFTDADVENLTTKFIEATKELQDAGFLSSGNEKLNPVLKGSGHSNGTDKSNPPVAGAKLGKDAMGLPGWFVPDPVRPGKFKQVFHS